MITTININAVWQVWLNSSSKSVFFLLLTELVPSNMLNNTNKIKLFCFKKKNFNYIDYLAGNFFPFKFTMPRNVFATWLSGKE